MGGFIEVLAVDLDVPSRVWFLVWDSFSFIFLLLQKVGLEQQVWEDGSILLGVWRCRFHVHIIILPNRQVVKNCAQAAFGSLICFGAHFSGKRELSCYPAVNRDGQASSWWTSSERAQGRAPEVFLYGRNSLRVVESSPAKVAPPWCSWEVVS